MHLGLELDSERSGATMFRFISWRWSELYLSVIGMAHQVADRKMIKLDGYKAVVTKRVCSVAALLWIAAVVSTDVVAQEVSIAQVISRARQENVSFAKIASEANRELSIRTSQDADAVLGAVLDVDVEKACEAAERREDWGLLLRWIADCDRQQEFFVSFSHEVNRELTRVVRQARGLSEDRYRQIDFEAMYTLRIVVSNQAGDAEALAVEAAANGAMTGSAYWNSLLSDIEVEDSLYVKLVSVIEADGAIGRLAVALADKANSAKLGGADIRHPLDSMSGLVRLRHWLTVPLEESLKASGAAETAAISLAFVKQPEWRELLDLGLRHPDQEVVLEAAWAGASRDDTSSVAKLVELSRDVRFSDKAVRYLGEVGRESDVPAEVREPDFRALAEMANWLAHPNELGRAPDYVEIVDKRKLTWPLEEEPVDVYLIRYTVKNADSAKSDEMDIGLVGPMTFCHFGMGMNKRPFEDIYGIHVFHELQAYDLIEDLSLAEAPGAYDYLLASWKGVKLDDIKLIEVVRLLPAVDYPRRLIAMASAVKNGEEGYVVLDGPRSAWYSKAQQPEDSPSKAVLMLHVGRQILGLGLSGQDAASSKLPSRPKN